MLDQKLTQWLEARGLDQEIVSRLGVSASQNRGADWIVIPYTRRGETVNRKYRGMDRKEFYQDADGQKIVYNFDCLLDDTIKSMPLVIVEGEPDCWAALQSGYPRCISVPDGAPAVQLGEGAQKKYSYLDDVLALTNDCREIILAVDNDGPGANLLHDLSLRFGKSRCKWIPYPKGCKDLNDALRLYGTKGVTECFNRAQWVLVDGVYRMDELTPPPYREAHTTGIDALNDHYKIRLGDFCVVTGIPSMGKSTFITDVCARMSARYGWNTCFASFEQHPTIDHKRNLRKWHIGHNGSWTTTEIQAADKWINDKFTFMVPNEDDDITLDWVLEKAHVAVVRHNAQIVVIDPWNEMDHFRPNGMSLTEYTGFAIKQLKKFAINRGIHLIVAAHPAKMPKQTDGTYNVPSLYDISDSAHWYNKADIGIVVHRPDLTTSLIRIAKSRYHDIIGKPGDVNLFYNSSINRYEEKL